MNEAQLWVTAAKQRGLGFLQRFLCHLCRELACKPRVGGQGQEVGDNRRRNLGAAVVNHLQGDQRVTKAARDVRCC